MPRFVLGDYHQQQARTRTLELRLFVLVILAAMACAAVIATHRNSEDLWALLDVIQNHVRN